MPSIDERIVRMNFDNAQFERGVQTSLNTLDKLEKSLQFQNGTTGLDKLQSAVQHFDLSAMASSIHSIEDRFSTLGIVGMTVIQNLTSKAMSLFGKIPGIFGSAINQIKTGGWSRAKNLEQARFMLKGLTGDLKEVERIISGPVNDAVTGTRFGLDEAAVAASTLYASGIKGTKELTHSLQAISGAATMTNKDYGEMAHIFSTVASNGVFMTEQLRQFASYGLNVSAVLKDWMKEEKGLVKTEEEINKMISGKEITYEMFASAMYKYWDLAADANSTYAGSLANVRAQLSKIGAEVAMVYLDKMIPLNVALINFLKPLKNELLPIFTIINGWITRITKTLTEFFNNSELSMGIARNIIWSFTYLYKAMGRMMKPFKLLYRELLPDGFENALDGVSRKVRKLSEGFYQFTKSVKGVFLIRQWRRIFAEVGYAISAFNFFIEHSLVLLKPFGRVALDVFSALSEILKVIARTFSGYIDGLFTDLFGEIWYGEELFGKLAKIIDNFLPSSGAIKTWGHQVAKSISKAAPSFKELKQMVIDAIDTISEYFGIAKGKVDPYINTIVDKILWLKENIENLFTGKAVDISWLEKVRGAFDTFVDRVEHGINVMKIAAGGATNFFGKVGNVLKTIFTAVGQVLGPVFTELKNVIGNFFADVNFNGVFDLVNSGVLTIIGLNLARIVKNLGDMSKNLKSMTGEGGFMKWFGNLGDFFDSILPKSIKKGIDVMTTSLKDLGKSIEANINAKTLKTVASSIAVLAGSLFALSLVDSDKLAAAVIIVTEMFAELGIAMEVFNRTGILGTKDNGFSKQILMLSVAIAVLSVAMVNLAQLSWEELARGLTGVALALVIFVGALKAIEVLIKDPTSLAAAAGAILTMSIAMIALGAALKIFATMDLQQIGTGLLAMGGALAILVVALGILGKVGPSVLAGAGAILITTTALYALAGALAIFSAMDPEKTAIGLQNMGIALAILVVGLAALGAVGPVVLASGGAILMAANAMLVLSAALLLLSNVDIAGAAVALITLAGAMTIIVIALTALSKAGLGAVVAAGSLLIVAAAIAVFSASMLALSLIPGEKILGILGMIGGGFAILLGSAVMAIALAPGLAALSAAFLAIGGAALMVGGALMLTAGALTIMSGALSILSTINMGPIADGFVKLSGGLLALSVASAVVTLFLVPFAALAAALVLVAASVSVAAVGFSILAGSLNRLKGLDIKTISDNVANLVAGFAALAIAGTALIPTAMAIKTISDSMVSMSNTAPIVANAIKIFASTVIIMSSAINRVTFKPFEEAFISLVGVVNDAKEVTGPLNDITDSMKGLADSATIMAPLSEKIKIIADSMVTLYDKAAPTADKLVTFVGTMSSLNKAAENISFASITEDAKELASAVSETVKYNSDLTAFRESIELLAESGGLLSPMANYFKDAANGVSTIKNVSPEAAEKFGAFVEQVKTAAEESNKITMQKLVTALSDIVQQIIIADSYSSNLADFSAAMHQVYEKGSDLQYVVGHLENITGALKLVKDDARDAGVNFTSFSNYMVDASETFKTVDFTHVSEQMYLLINPIKDLTAKRDDIYTIASALENLGGKWGGIKTLSDYFGDFVENIIKVNVRAGTTVDKVKEFVDELVVASDRLNRIDFAGAAKKFQEFSSQVSDGAYSLSDSMNGVGRALASNFTSGLNAYWREAKTAGEKLANEVVSALSSFESRMTTVGSRGAAGFVSGLTNSDALRRLWSAGYAAGHEVEKGAKAALDIHSPSKVFYKIGRYVIDGLVDGIEDRTAQKREQIQKAFQSLIKVHFTDEEMFENYKIASAQLKTYNNNIKENNKLNKQNESAIKRLTKDTNKRLLGYTKSNKVLSRGQRIELGYLRKKLKLNGTLTKAEYKRYANLLGLSKFEKEIINNNLSQIETLTEETAKNNDENERYLGLIKEIKKEMASGAVYSVGVTADMYNQIATSLKNFGKSLYENTDAYEENNAKIHENEETVNQLKETKKDLVKEQKSEQTAINNTNKHLKSLLATEKNQTKYETKNGKLTKEASKQREKDNKRITELQKKLKQNGKLTKEEYLELAKLLGLKGKKLENIEEELKLLDDQQAAYDETTNKIKECRQAIKDLNTENKELDATIKNGAIQMLTELQNKVKDTVSSALNPLKESLEDNINILDKFSITDLGEKFTMNTAIGNLASFGNTWASYKKDLEEFMKMDYSDEMKKYVESLGPSAANLLKVLLNATSGEISSANMAFMSSQEAEVDQWLNKIEAKAEAQQKFYDDLKRLRASGLSDEAYRAIMEEGYESAGAIVDGLVSGLNIEGNNNLDRVNEAYKNYFTLPEKLADQALLDAAASFEGVGSSMYDALFKGFNEGFNSYDIESVRKLLGYFVDEVYKEEDKEETKAKGAEVTTTYVDGMADGLSSNVSSVTTEADTVSQSAADSLAAHLSEESANDLGANVDKGLAGGIRENASLVTDASNYVAFAALTAAMSALAVRSPSKEFETIGMYVDYGFANGIYEYGYVVNEAMTSVATGSLNTMRERLAELSESLSAEDNAPVIKPILDLSNVEAGAAQVRSMFESTHSAAAIASAQEAIAEGGVNAGAPTYNFTQNNYSPKALSRIDIYRQTRNQLAMVKGATK